MASHVPLIDSGEPIYLLYLFRGYKIPVIENLGAALDQYDTIDFSDNEIRKLDGFPFMNRVKSLMMNNNRIVRSVNSNN